MKLTEIVEILKTGKVENPRHEAFMLIERFCNLRSESLLAMSEIELDSPKLLAAAQKRVSGYPLQYILGSVGFYGLDFYINEGCLIPRSDTEILVEKAISLIPTGAHFTDACCGSGCIVISVLKERPDLTATAVDLYDSPINLTSQNSKLHSLENRLEIKKCDIMDDNGEFSEILQRTDFLLSNPPYIKTDVIPTLNIDVLHEPLSALDGGADGMVFYSKFAEYLHRYSLPALLEIGYDQAEDIRRIANANSLCCDVYKDYSYNDRVAYLYDKKDKE